MRKLYFVLLLFTVACVIASCQGKGDGSMNPDPQPGLITGIWSLQQQHFVQYIGGAKKTDTTYLASSFNLGHLQFNDDGTFNSASYRLSGTTNPPLSGSLGNVASQDSTYGTYSMLNSALTLNAGIAGFETGIAFFASTTPTTIATNYALISQSAQVTQLTSSKLDIHLEYVYTMGSTSGTTQTYKNEEDYYYTK
jgi:hypothetical protein